MRCCDYVPWSQRLFSHGVCKNGCHLITGVGVGERSTRRFVRLGETALTASLAIGAWTYLGYPAVIVALSALRRGRDTPNPAPLPTMTVVIAAYNEADVIELKLKDTWAQDYPADLLEVIVVADGSTDATAALAERLATKVLFYPERSGKSAAVNRAIESARGEIVCLTDANCSLAPGALQAVARPFADERVGIVSGAKTTAGTGSLAAGESLYWRFESRVKAAESEFGAAMGAHGELCAVRKATWRPIPDGVINDDFFLTLDALERGYQARFVPAAVSVESASERAGDEFERRTRVAAGTWQGLVRHRSLGSPRRGLVALAFWSHRVLRNVVVPLLLPVTFLLSLALARRSRLARRLLEVQLVSYAAAAAGIVADAPALGPVTEIALVNAANVRGGWRYVSGRQRVTWEKVDRGLWVSGNPVESHRTPSDGQAR
jgi:poly-beta-1,6-N-acetyl-D-glucosamine synthase